MRHDSLWRLFLLLCGVFGYIHIVSAQEAASSDNGFVDAQHMFNGVTIRPGGYLRYNKETHTYQMKDVDIASTKDYSLEIKASEHIYTLEINGTCSMSPQIFTRSSLVIRGAGKLSVREPNGYGAILIANNQTLTLTDGVQLDLFGASGIEGIWDQSNHLIINGASLHIKTDPKDANAPYPFALGSFESIQLTDAEIISPQGAKIGTYEIQDPPYRYVKQFIVDTMGHPVTTLTIQAAPTKKTQPITTLTTSRAIGETIECSFNATEPDSISIEGLEYISEGYYKILSQTFRIKGDLTKLIIANCNLTQVDLSQLSSLGYLNCSNNQLTSLDVSKLTSLGYLDCAKNRLTSLNISQLPRLSWIWCSDNQLTQLNLSQLPSFTTLYCYNNQLTQINLSQISTMTLLVCHNNQLTSLDVSKQTHMEAINCSNNQLSTINVDQLKELVTLNVSNNKITAQTLEQIIQELPDRSSMAADSRGNLVPINTQNFDTNLELSEEMLSKLSSRGWDAYEIGKSFCLIRLVPLELPDNMVASDVIATTNGHKLPNPQKIFIGEEFSIHYSLEEAKRSDGQNKYSQAKWLVDGVVQSTGLTFDYKVQEGKHTLSLQVEPNTLGIAPVTDSTPHAWISEGILHIVGAEPGAVATLYDSVGTPILDVHDSSTNLKHLAPGNYFIRISDHIYKVVL